MTKKEIVKRISEDIGLTQLKTKDIVQRTLDAIIDTLVSEGRIELRNFGVFEVKQRAPRKARNPRTGDKVYVPSKNVVTFKPGKRNGRIGSKDRSVTTSAIGRGLGCRFRERRPCGRCLGSGSHGFNRVRPLEDVETATARFGLRVGNGRGPGTSADGRTRLSVDPGRERPVGSRRWRTESGSEPGRRPWRRAPRDQTRSRIRRVV